ncbi:LuxR C-terminal-related transcriptional regulator [Pseudophaeobacter sp.]|uniref:helix-turn-helix transcriptional regulator n=1 Tax=Pseudophaeobacter sp. TaxID=1971739 RepID=UPI003297A323
MNDIFRLNTVQTALLGPDPFWDCLPAVQVLENLLKTDRLYQVAPCHSSDGIEVTSQAMGAQLSDGIQALFTGFDSAGHSTFTDPYASFLHRTIRSAGTGAFHDGPLFDREAREETEVHHAALAPNRIDRQMAISAPLSRGEAMLIAGYGHNEMPAEDSEALAWLSFLAPAFAAGHQLRAELSRFNQDWHQTVARHQSPALFIDHRGRILHRSDRFTEQLSTLPELEKTHAAAIKLAKGIIGQTRRDTAMASKPASTEARLELSTCQVRLQGMIVPQLYSDLACLVTLDIQRSPQALPDPLTKRERDVALLLCDGKTDKEVARDLGISPHTARRHVERILQKCGVHNRTQAAERLRAMGPLL